MTITWYSFSTLSGTLISFALSYFVYLNVKRKSSHVYYAIILICMGIWCFDSFFVSTPPINNFTAKISRILHLGGIYSSYFFILWIFGIVGKKTLLHTIYKIYSTAMVLLLTILNFKSGSLINIINYKHVFVPFHEAGKYYYIFPLFLFTNGIIGCKELYDNIKLEIGLKKIQLIYILFATIVMYIAGTTYFLFAYNLNVWPIADIFVILSNLVITYAIVRHQLMEIEVIIRRATVFAGLFAFAYGVFTTIAYLGQTVFQKWLGSNQWIGLIPSVFIVVVGFDPLRNMLVRATDKFLFQKKYDYKELLKTFSSDVLTVLELDQLVKLTVARLSSLIRLENCVMMLFDKEKNNYKVAASNNLKNKNLIFEKDSPIITFIETTHHPIKVDKDILAMIDEGSLKTDIKNLQAELVLPIILHNDVFGLISLGRKKSGEEFSQEDIDILLPLAQTEAIALSNAELFDELGKTQAEAAQREKMAVIGTLAAGINHEICNPLGIVRGNCESFLLNKAEGFFDNKTDNELINEAMNIMDLSMKEIDRATSITKKLSSFAKPSKGEILDNVDIDSELDEVLSLVGYELKLDHIHIVKNIPSHIPDIKADRKQIQEIFFNLIRNGAQAITGDGKITISAYQLDGKVLVDIDDTGCGIPEDKIDRIFHPFYTTKEAGKGTGLGLFIVRQVVERNNGKISVKSKEGEGTTFTLEFQSSNN